MMTTSLGRSRRRPCSGTAGLAAPPKLDTVRAGGTHSSGEYSVNADDLLPESLPGSAPLFDPSQSDREVESPFDEPTMQSHEHAEVPSSESPTIERVVPDLFA